MSLENFNNLLVSKERNRKRKKYFPEYWEHRNYLPKQAFDLAYKHYTNTITEEEVEKTRVAQCIIIDFWLIRGYTLQEAIAKVSEKQKANGQKIRDKYTLEERRKFSTSCLEYYLDRGYTLQEAKELRSKRQATFSLEKCVERHGEERGKEVFEDRQERWQASLRDKPQEEIDDMHRRQGITLENYINKYGKELGEKKYAVWLEEYSLRLKRNGMAKYSQESIIFFKSFVPNEILERSDYGEKEHLLVTNNKIYFFDFRFKNVLIEYHGYIYHANPDAVNLDEWKSPFGLTGRESVKKDAEKRKTAEEQGFKVFEVYSNDSVDTKRFKISRILEALYEANQDEVI